LFDLRFDNPNQQMQQIFTDPKTGTFSRANAISSRKSADTDPSGQLKAQWIAVEDNILNERTNQKYLRLGRHGVYANSLDAKDDYTNRNKLVNFEYVLLDYASVPDAEIKLTDADYKEYYEKNKFRFKNPTETRTFEYVTFDAAPSKQDSAEAKI